MWKRSLILNLLLSSLWTAGGASLTADSPHPSQPARLGPRSHVAFSHALPPLDGTRLQVTTVEVTYPPGGSSAPHSHPCPVVGYVIEGAVRMQVKDGAESVYKTGDSFYEAPNGSRTHVSSLEGWGNSRYTTGARRSKLATDAGLKKLAGKNRQPSLRTLSAIIPFLSLSQCQRTNLKEIVNHEQQPSECIGSSRLYNQRSSVQLGEDGNPVCPDRPGNRLSGIAGRFGLWRGRNVGYGNFVVFNMHTLILNANHAGNRAPTSR